MNVDARNPKRWLDGNRDTQRKYFVKELSSCQSDQESIQPFKSPLANMLTTIDAIKQSDRQMKGCFGALIYAFRRYDHFEDRVRADFMANELPQGQRFLLQWRKSFKDSGEQLVANARDTATLIAQEPSSASDWLKLFSSTRRIAKELGSDSNESRAAALLLTYLEENDVFLRLSADPNIKTHHSQLLEPLDLSSFRNKFFNILAHADRVAITLWDEADEDERHLLPAAAISAYLKLAYWDAIDNSSTENSSDPADGVLKIWNFVGKAVHHSEMLWETDGYATQASDSFEYVGIRNSGFVARIGLVAAAYKSLLQNPILKNIANALVAALLCTPEESKERRSAFKGLLKDSKIRELLSISTVQAMNALGIDQNGDLSPLTTEYGNAFEWSKHSGTRGAATNASQYFKSMPTSADHDFVASVLTDLLNCERFRPHAIVALSSKLGVFFIRDILEPSCITPHRNSSDNADKINTSAFTSASKLVETIKLISQRVVRKSNTALTGLAQKIYFQEDSSFRGEDFTANGVSWKRALELPRNKLRSDEHLAPGHMNPSYLWMFGAPFQAKVDELIRLNLLALRERNQGLQPIFSGDRFCRFILLIPQCVDPASLNARNAIHFDWPGTRAMSYAISEAASLVTEIVNIRDHIRDPIVNKIDASPTNPYFG